MMSVTIETEIDASAVFDPKAVIERYGGSQ